MRVSIAVSLAVLLFLASTAAAGPIWMRRSETSIQANGQECIARAFRVFKKVGFEPEQNLRNGVWGSNGDRWTIILCNDAPGGRSWVNIVSSALEDEADDHYRDHEKIGQLMGQSGTTNTSDPPTTGGGSGTGSRTTKPPHEFRGRNGTRLTYDCAANAGGSVWGTDVYTDDSNVCGAAIHAGVIDRRGGSVTIEIREGRSSYSGSTRNLVTSANYGSYAGSFVVLGEALPSSGPMRVPAATRAGDYRAEKGLRLRYDCAGNESGSVWGTDTYTDDSSVCLAARHAGLINRNGGTVIIEIRPGRSSYQGTMRNGVATSSYGEYSGSFVFVED